jgi:hypothetical protein
VRTDDHLVERILLHQLGVKLRELGAQLGAIGQAVQAGDQA